MSFDSDTSLILVNDLRPLLGVAPHHRPGPLGDCVEGEGDDVVDEDNGLDESQDSVTEDTHQLCLSALKEIKLELFCLLLLGQLVRASGEVFVFSPLINSLMDS